MVTQNLTFYRYVIVSNGDILPVSIATSHYGLSCPLYHWKYSLVPLNLIKLENSLQKTQNQFRNFILFFFFPVEALRLGLYFISLKGNQCKFLSNRVAELVI